MNIRYRIPPVSAGVIAAFALLLGCMIESRILPIVRSHWSLLVALNTPQLWQIAAVAFFVSLLVTLRILRDRRSRLERDLLEAFLEHIPDNVYFKDRNSRFLRVNKAMASYFGLEDPRQAINKTDADMFSRDHAVEAREGEQEIMRTGEPILGIEEKETWPDGHESWVLTTKLPLKDRGGRIIGTMGISHNITERKQADERIRYMALHDALTGLPNRTLLADRLSQAITLARRNGNNVAVLMLDLDRFKTVNDSLGHHIGDCLLEMTAKRLKSCLRESDIVARWGGDEFVVGLQEVHDVKSVEQIARKILSNLGEPFLIEGHRLQIGASIGICQYPVDGENPEALLEIAVAAMYESKKRGRGIYSFFTPELTQATRRRQKLERDLRQAIVRDEFVLYFQPLIAIDSGHITGVEALLRWNHPELGMVFPGEFIPLLEELGLMVKVGTRVLSLACSQNVAWQKQGLPPVRVAVNVSAQQFYRGDIVNTVKTVLNETGMDSQWLELELTESMTLDDSEGSIAIMQKLKQVGVSLSLDDFGTGWSSLSYLRRFPLDHIKIDKSFLRDIDLNSSSEAVVRSILNLGRSLGLSCIAEGVETHEQLSYLQTQKCAEMQGFLYSKAVPAGECAELMSAAMSPEPAAVTSLLAI